MRRAEINLHLRVIVEAPLGPDHDHDQETREAARKLVSKIKGARLQSDPLVVQVLQDE